MDPLTAFSLACGVIQVVDFSVRTLAKCKELYQEGVLSEYSELEESTKHLTGLQDDLQLHRIVSSAKTPPRSQDQTLLELARDCSATAKELTAKLEDLRIQGRSKKRDAVKKTWKAFREKKEIQAIQKRLDGYRKAVDTQILVDLRRRLDVNSLKTDRGFQELNDEVQKLIIGLSQGATTFKTVTNAIQSEHKQTRKLIVEINRQYQQSQDEKKSRKRLLKSLWFDELHSREEQIEHAHQKTFEWIFEHPEHRTGRWDNFVEWLERSDHIYWIHGKAGSGKSTLMSFLCQDDRLSKSLAIWSENETVLVPRFYFWSGGNRMEKSIEGLLRSLLWQIINGLPELHVGVSQDDLHSSGLGTVWTERRLRKLLHDMIQQLPETHSVCFFIDGLDEFDGEQARLISLLKEIARYNKIKICLSSRPLQVFVRAFETASKLCLQDMTRKDIRVFVLDEFRDISQESLSIAEYLTETILDRAEGVFLWVSLAVADQLRGFGNGDNPGQLMERLTSLPSQVEKVYERMLNEIEKCYRHEAAVFLQIALHGRDSSLLSHVWASQPGLDDMFGSDENIPVLDLVALSHKTRSRIITTCGGLLEVTEDQNIQSRIITAPRDTVEVTKDRKIQSWVVTRSRMTQSRLMIRSRFTTPCRDLLECSGNQETTDDETTGHGEPSDDEEKSDDEENTDDEEPTDDEEKSDDEKNTDDEELTDDEEKSDDEKNTDDEELTDDEEKSGDEENADDKENNDNVKNSDDEENTDNENKPRGRGFYLTISHSDNGGSSDEEENTDDEPSHYGNPEEITDLQIQRLDGNIGVHLVHRSAVDFMRDPNKGGAFLEKNTPDSFHPQVLYVKALIAQIRLYGLLDRHESIENVMINIWLAEHETEVAQTILCNLMEKTMSSVDRKFGNTCDDSHWSERWEGSHEHWKRAKGEHHKRQEDSSQPNPSTPVESIGCQPDTLDISCLILGAEWNLLTFAASQGILRYVRHCVEKKSKMLKRDAVAFLLHLSMYSVQERFVDGHHIFGYGIARVVTGLHCAQELLSRGADLTSEVTSDPTLWSMFLVRMFRVLHSIKQDINLEVGCFGLYRDDVIYVLQTEFAKTMIAFIANGAELNQMIFITLCHPSDLPDRIYRCRLRLSVWAVAELCLKGRSELSLISEACIHAGAPYSARCFKVEVAGEFRHLGIIVEYELSEAESNTVLKVCGKEHAKASTRRQIHEDLSNALNKIRQRPKIRQTPVTRISILDNNKEGSYEISSHFRVEPITHDFRLFESDHCQTSGKVSTTKRQISTSELRTRPTKTAAKFKQGAYFL